MKIRTAEEYIINTLAVTGELKKVGLSKRTPYSEKHIRSVLRKLEEEKKIKEYKYPDGSYYRLRDPGVKCIDKSLLPHFELMVGEQGNRYRGKKTDRIKQRQMYEIAERAFESGLKVDGILFDSEYEFAPTQTILQELSSEEKSFLTKK